MDLSTQLDEYATQICDGHLEAMPEMSVVADLIRRSHPVIAAVLASPDEPVVARQRAFSVAVRALLALTGPEQQACASVLAGGGVPSTSAPGDEARAA